jgi:hypothetical protein
MAPPSAEKESNTGKVFSVSGPVIVAEDMIGCAMYELVCWDTLTFSVRPVYVLIHTGRCWP